MQEARLSVAMKELKAVEQELEDKENDLKQVKAQYENAIANKEVLFFTKCLQSVSLIYFYVHHYLKVYLQKSFKKTH